MSRAFEPKPNNPAVAHSEKFVRRLCNKAILMEHGRMVWSGGVDEGLSEERQSAVV